MAELPDEGGTSSPEDEAIFANMDEQISCSVGSVEDIEPEKPLRANYTRTDSRGKGLSPEDEALYSKMYEEDEVPLNDHSSKPPSIGKLRGTKVTTSDSSLLAAEATFARMYEEKSSESSSPSIFNKRVAGAASTEYDTDSSLHDEAIFAKMYEQTPSESSLSGKMGPPSSIDKRVVRTAPVEYDTDSSANDAAIFAKIYEQKSIETSNNEISGGRPSGERRKRTSLEDEAMFAALYREKSVDDTTDSSLQDAAHFAKMYEQKSSETSTNEISGGRPSGERRKRTSIEDEAMFVELYRQKSNEMQPLEKGNVGIDMVPSYDKGTDSSRQDGILFSRMIEQKFSQTSSKGKPVKNVGIDMAGNIGIDMVPSYEEGTDSSLQDEALFAKMFEQQQPSTTALQSDSDSDSDSSLIGPNTGKQAADVKSALSIPQRLPTVPFHDESTSSLLPSDHFHPEQGVPSKASNAIERKTSKNKFKTGAFTFGALSPTSKKKKTIKHSKFPNVKRGFQNDQMDLTFQPDPRQGDNNVREIPARRPPPQRGLVHYESELSLPSPRQKNRRGNRRGSLLGALGGLAKQKEKKDTDLPPTEEELEMMRDYEEKHGLNQDSSQFLLSPQPHGRKQSNRRGSVFGAMPQKQRAPPPQSPGQRQRKQSNRRGSMFGAMPQKQAASFRSPLPRGRQRRLSMFGKASQSVKFHSPQHGFPPVIRHDPDRELQDSPLAELPRQKVGRNRRGSVFGALGGHKEYKGGDLPPTQEDLEMMNEYEKKWKDSASHLEPRAVELMSPPQTMRKRGLRRGSISTGLLQALKSPVAGSRRNALRNNSESQSSTKSLMSPYSSPRRRKPLARRGSIQAGLPGGPPLREQIDPSAVMSGALERVDSVGSIDISLSSESVESGEMFAVPKKYDDELGNIESSYRGMNEFRGGSMEKRHAAVGLNMAYSDDHEDDPAVIGYRNTMLKRGRKALLSIEDLAKNDDELFDFLNAVAKEDGEMQWMKETLEGNIYSLVYTAKWRSAAFWFSMFIATFQVAMPGLAMLDLIDFQNPANPFQAPNNVSLQVRAMGIMALLLAVAQFWIFMAAVEKLLKGPPPRWEDTPPGASKMKFYLAYLLQFTMGSMFIITIFTLVAQSTNVISLLLNFAALEFITGVDRVLFKLAKRGYFTNKIKMACDDVTNVLVIRRKGGRTFRRIVLATAAATINFLYFQIVVQQQTGAFDCSSLEVQFGDGFNSVLPLFSGIYTHNKNYRDNRPVYWDKRRRAAFRYCGNSDGHLFSFDEGGYFVFNFISENSEISSVDDMCSNYMLRSPNTKGFNILDEPTSTWVTKKRLTDSIQYSVDYFSIRCVDCDENTCNGECQGRVCKCLEGQYGPNCQFSDPPCENIDTDSRTKRFQKAGSMYSSEFSILKKSDGFPALSYSRPIYTDSWSEKGLKDGLVLMNFGRRYFLFRMSFFHQISTAALGDYLEKVHPYYDWLRYLFVLNEPILVNNTLGDGPSDAVMIYRPDFGSDPIDFGTSYDSLSPLDLSWSRVGTSILNRGTFFDFLKRGSSVDTVLLCSRCSDSSPCFGNSKCTEQGTCECSFSLAGRLCEVDCFDEPESEVCSNCFQDPSGEGCLQCHKDLNATDCPWNFGVGAN